MGYDHMLDDVDRVKPEIDEALKLFDNPADYEDIE
jgi:hypothetical protein